MGKVMQIDENAPEAVKQALDKGELSVNKGYEITKKLAELPEEEREIAAAEALEYEKAKRELAGKNAEIDRKAFEKAIMLDVSEENVRIWTDCCRMRENEIADSAKEAREIAGYFIRIAEIIEDKLLPVGYFDEDGDDGDDDEYDEYAGFAE